MNNAGWEIMGYSITTTTTAATTKKTSAAFTSLVCNAKHYYTPFKKE